MLVFDPGLYPVLEQRDRCNAADAAAAFLGACGSQLGGVSDPVRAESSTQVRPELQLFRRDGVFVTYICNHALIHSVNFDTLPFWDGAGNHERPSKVKDCKGLWSRR
jgi:hypothetical protein